ncbi:hypothetical protein QBC47DRAFT_364910 [Echria macrotheca]|uniref:ubiquitinyl hydrolase 1 n=1 Tax=Echria macrotheca TaxID=438768 RepID=A0AAJ0B3D7_9PEZI|nr:hypothetical protein QBC47DRAFT_364910 [Echria macrotheca]
MAQSGGHNPQSELGASCGMPQTLHYIVSHLRAGKWILHSQHNIIDKMRAEELFSYSLRLPESRSEIMREISNAGDHKSSDWEPLEYPENLLLEIEQGIVIRPVQNEIAAKMRTPPRMQSSVMQLNMGEGKSCVRMPMVAF